MKAANGPSMPLVFLIVLIINAIIMLYAISNIIYKSHPFFDVGRLYQARLV